MTRFVAKLGFIHRILWHRDTTYRWAVLLGPPPLIGCALAALMWQFSPLLETQSQADNSNAPWAHWNRPQPTENQPFVETPRAALPLSDAHGAFIGFQSGWVGAIHPLAINAALEVNVIASSLAQFTLDQQTIPLERVVDAAPPNGLFVASVKSLFVVRTAGLYAFSARLVRTGAKSANCLIRLASNHHKMVSEVVLNSAGSAVLNSAATEFQLEPGLFLVQAVTGCWRGGDISGAGEMALMVRHPGEKIARPAAADELIRPVKNGADESR